MLDVMVGYINYTYGEIGAYIIGGCLATYRPLLVGLGTFIGERVTEITSRDSTQNREQTRGTQRWRDSDATWRANSNNFKLQRVELDDAITSQSKSQSCDESCNTREAKEAFPMETV